MTVAVDGPATIPTATIHPNPFNPRRYFNDESLDLLRTSIQEIGILVPLIVYPADEQPGSYVLLDGERRLRCALLLGLEQVPVNITPEPSEIDNVLRMFNIHSVREDWPLVSVALSLQNVMDVSGETRETRLAEMTGLTRASVRRAKRLLALPKNEIELIRDEAHLNRIDQVHREDLYLEIMAAESVLRNTFPEIAEQYSREEIIRKFAMKREQKSLKSVTEFRAISRIVEAVGTGLVPRETVIASIRTLIDDPRVTPSEIADSLPQSSYVQVDLLRRSNALVSHLEAVPIEDPLTDDLRSSLRSLRDQIDRLLLGRG